MIRSAVLCVLLLYYTDLCAQEIIELSKVEAETIFLEQNLRLLSEKLEIESQQAEVIQARLWPNPEFSVGEINLWENNTVEPSPPFFNNFGRNQQVAFEINQLIETAGKRKKRIALEEIDVSKSEQVFEKTLRNLKLELRLLLTELQYLKLSKDIHQNLLTNLSTLLRAFENQMQLGHLSRATFARLKAEELQIQKKILELDRFTDDIQKELRLLMRFPPTIQLVITDEKFNTQIPELENHSLLQLFDNAKENRPDYQLVLLEETYSENQLKYEKAIRIPDVEFGITYDRNGSTMLDFVGVGMSFELPIFNRNKGNILQAQINIEKAEIEREQTELEIQNQVYLSYQVLRQALDFYHSIDENYERELDDLLENYTRNFSSKNLSLLEYIDFLDTYLTNKIILLDAQKEIEIKREEFYHVLGYEL